eukprot:CFRG2406T1
MGRTKHKGRKRTAEAHGAVEAPREEGDAKKVKVQDNTPDILEAGNSGKNFAAETTDNASSKKTKGQVSIDCPFNSCSEVFATIKPHGIYECSTLPGKKVYGCLVKGCTKTFINTKKLKIHFKTHEGENALDCQCHGCMGRIGANEVATVKIPPMETEILSTDPVTCAGTAIGSFSIACPFNGCSEVFVTPNPHGVYNCTTNAKNSSYGCIVHGCGQAFISTKQLKKHVELHSGKNRLDCKCHLCLVRSGLKSVEKPGSHKTTLNNVSCPYDECSESFELEAHRRYRCKTISSHPSMAVCLYAGCSQAFIKEKELKKHVGSTHKGKTQDVLICDCCQCEKMYAKM